MVDAVVFLSNGGDAAVILSSGSSLLPYASSSSSLVEIFFAHYVSHSFYIMPL
jgi:hypothetical protein